ncbi:MAG: class I SAM-dependent methyltransferase [Gemmatimonadota bacterium]
MNDPQCALEDLSAQFGKIDIYLFDQLLRGRLTSSMRVLDAGCGPGRNSEYLMRSGVEVFGIDSDPEEVGRVRSLAATVAPGLPESNFQVGVVTDLPFQDDDFGFVICVAVLHFAEDEAEFEAMMDELWRVLAPGGVFLARLASTIGIEDLVKKSHGRWHALPDGTDRFLVDEAYLLRITSRIGAELLDPLKTTNVQNLRAMTTWVLKKS